MSMLRAANHVAKTLPTRVATMIVLPETMRAIDQSPNCSKPATRLAAAMVAGPK
jgi:hypothetical protein